MLTRNSHSGRPVPRRLHSQALAAIFLCLMALAGCASPKRFEFTRIEMGVQCRIVVYGQNQASTENVAAAAFAEVARLDAIMSDYRPESEVSRLSRAKEGELVLASAELQSVLNSARYVSIASDGAFDVTAGPLVALWRTARREGRLPQPEELSAAKDLVDWRYIEVDLARFSVFTKKKGVKVDLGAIAKGYAAQHAVEVLTALKHPRCMVALSGDIVVGDAPPAKPGWLVTTPSGERLTLTNCGVSTSGDDRQYVEIDGIRYSHIIDTRTGLGAVGPRPTCTVIAPRGEWADALSTAGYLVGRDGWEKLEREFPRSRVIWGPEATSRE